MQVPDIIGLPPHTASDPVSENGHVSAESLIEDSFPICIIEPAMPKFTRGMQGFDLEKKHGMFSEDLGKVGYEATLPLKVAHTAVNPPSETFSNTFGESLMQEVTNVVSETARQVRFMSGGGKVSEGAHRLASFMAEGGMGEMGKKAGGAIAAIGKGAAKLEEKGGVLANVLMGNRVDFPQIWKTCEWRASYSMNVRLYNPYPGNTNAVKYYIIGPLCALLMFVLPRSEDGESFTWPFCCYFRFPGAVQTTSGFITNITVAKGGDDNIWAMNQRPGMVDVKIDFGTLYSVLINGEDIGRISLPTIHEYALELEQTKPSVKTDEWYQKSGTPGPSTVPPPLNKTFPPGGRDEKDRDDPSSRLDLTSITLSELISAWTDARGG